MQNKAERSRTEQKRPRFWIRLDGESNSAFLEIGTTVSKPDILTDELPCLYDTVELQKLIPLKSTFS